MLSEKIYQKTVNIKFYTFPDTKSKSDGFFYKSRMELIKYKNKNFSVEETNNLIRNVKNILVFDTDTVFSCICKLTLNTNGYYSNIKIDF